MNTRTARFSAVLRVAILSFLVHTGSSWAVCFDAIVPSVSNLDTAGTVGTSFLGWGWLIATDETISVADMDSAIMAVSLIGDPLVTVATSSGFGSNTAIIGDLAPGEVGGFESATGSYSVFRALLESGEEIKGSGQAAFWQLLFNYPVDHEGTATLIGTVEIGGDVLSYETTVYFGDFDPPGSDIDPLLYWPEAQRISACANAPPVLSLNPPPTPPSYPVGVEETLVIDLSATDPDEDALSFAMGNAPTGADLIDNNDGTAQFTWTPEVTQGRTTYPNVLLSVTDNGAPMLSDSAEITIAVDAPFPPVLDPIGDRNVRESETLTINLTASDFYGLPLNFAVSNAPTGASLTDNQDGTAVFSWTPTFVQSEGSPYAVLFTVTSGTGTDQEEIDITVGNVNRRPDLDPIGSRVGTEGETLQIFLTASDPDPGDTLAFAVSEPPADSGLVDSNDGSAVFTWTPNFEQAGGYSVTFSVTDDGETDAVPDPRTDSETVSIQIGDGDRPPVLAPIGSRQVQEEDELRIILTASDPDGGPLSFAAEGLPAGASFVDNGDATALFRWTPAAGVVGDFHVTFTVADAGDPPLTDAETVLIEVQPISNRQPSLSVAGGLIVNEGAEVRLTLNATDPDGDALTITADGLPAGSTFVDNENGSATFSWIPGPSQQGTYPVTFSVYDNGIPQKSDQVSVSLRVFSAGDANRDGQVDRGDVELVLDQLHKNPPPGSPADVDQDGEVTILDARRAAMNCSNELCKSQ